MKSKEVFISFDCKLLLGPKNDWDSNIPSLFLRQNGYLLYHTQILLGRVMVYIQESFGRKEKRENVTVEWRRGIMGMEESIVGLKDD